MIDGIFRIEEMRAEDTPYEFETRIGSANVTMRRDYDADFNGRIYFSFPNISWCDPFYVDADEPVAVLVEETWEEAALDIEFDLMKKGMV